jgi:hypothetical protein
MTDQQLAADRSQAAITIGSLRSLRDRQHDRMTKTERQCLRLAEQALGMFLERTIEEA